MLGRDGLLAPKCILLVKWGKKVPALAARSERGFILAMLGKTDRRIADDSFSRRSFIRPAFRQGVRSQRMDCRKWTAKISWAIS
jgi:hypothetical protein